MEPLLKKHLYMAALSLILSDSKTVISSFVNIHSSSNTTSGEC